MFNIQIVKYPMGFQVRLYSEVLGCNQVNRYDKEQNEIEAKYGKNVIKVGNEYVDWTTGQIMSGFSLFENLGVHDEYIYLDKDFNFEDLDTYEIRKEKEKHDDYIRHSLARTRNSVYYISRSNIWDWFVTLTLSPDKVDRYDYNACRKKVRKWLNNLKDRVAPDLFYIIVPEQHEDGAWHFHGLFGGADSLNFVDSGLHDKKGRIIYNLFDYKLGWTTATRVSDTKKASGYLCKYITKEICTQISGRNRYWVSRNINRASVFQGCLSRSTMDLIKDELFQNSSWYKKQCTEFCDVLYFEIDDLPKGVFVDDLESD